MERVRSRRAARHPAAADRAGALAAVHHTEAVSAGAAIAAAVHVAAEFVLTWARSAMPAPGNWRLACLIDSDGELIRAMRLRIRDRGERACRGRCLNDRQHVNIIGLFT